MSLISALRKKARSAVIRIRRGLLSALSFLREEVAADRKRDKVEASEYQISRSGSCSFCTDNPICMLAHYASDDKVDDNLIAYLCGLHSCRIDIVMISTCQSMPKEEIDKALKYCALVITRKNLGYDFYSWKIGCQAYPGYVSHRGMIWANDSILVDKRLLARTVAKAFQSNADIFGLTDSYRHEYHLQSYFLRFSQETTLGADFQKFLESIRVHRHKPTIIRYYEVGLSRKLGSKHSLEAMIKTKDLLSMSKKTSLRKLNPTIDMWRELIEKYSFPFAKRELFSKRGVSIEEIRKSFDKITESGKFGVPDA